MPLRPYQDYRRYVGAERPPRTVGPTAAYPAWAPPRWTLGVYWRWWVGDPGRILVSYATGVLLTLAWWTVGIAAGSSAMWFFWAVALTAFAVVPAVLYGPRVWREWRRVRRLRP